MEMWEQSLVIFAPYVLMGVFVALAFKRDKKMKKGDKNDDKEKNQE